MPDNSLEVECWKEGHLMCGCDEAGMGCLAGSLFVAGVVFPIGYDFGRLSKMGLNDSKQVLEKKRFEIAEVIKLEALHFFCISASAAEIDQRTAWHARFDKAAIGVIDTIKKLNTSDITVIIDGNMPIKNCPVSSRCLIKGDTKCYSIAAASILAKTSKDKEMFCLDTEYPAYAWKANKGYGSALHMEAIRKNGITEHHRSTYCKKVLSV